MGLYSQYLDCITGVVRIFGAQGELSQLPHLAEFTNFKKIVIIYCMTLYSAQQFKSSRMLNTKFLI